MRKRTTKKTTAKTPDSKSTSIEMTSRGEREGGGGRRSGETEEKRRFSRDLIDGPVHSVGTMQPFNTVTTVSSPSGFRLAQHMTIAGSFLDFALFVADVEHLKFILDAGKDKINYYTLLVVLIIGSLTLQLIVVFLLFIVGFKKPQKTTVTTRNSDENPLPGSSNGQVVAVDANGNQNTVIEEIVNSGESTILNHVIICLVTVIAIINVFVTVFGDRSAESIISSFKESEARRLAHNTTAHF